MHLKNNLTRNLRFPWVMNNSLFDVVENGLQCLTIPRTGRYRFEVIGASWVSSNPGARIIGKVRLQKGEKITVALGQRGNRIDCGNGGTFVVKENGISDPQPLFVAAGAGGYQAGRRSNGYHNAAFSKARLCQTASGNHEIGSSGVQDFFPNDQKDFFCGGAGYLKGPVTIDLRKDSVAPKSYKDGLIGGKAIDYNGTLTEGGFGGGGAYCYKNGNRYLGAGGGYTGGGTQINGDGNCYGGGGGSFSIDDEAQFDHVGPRYAPYVECTVTVTYLD